MNTAALLIGITAILLFLVIASAGRAAPLHYETSITKRLAPSYNAIEIEHKIPGTLLRVDLLTNTHAIEVDWSDKYCSGVGQALLYAMKTGKKPGLILLCKKGKYNFHHLRYARELCAVHSIQLWVEYV